MKNILKKLALLAIPVLLWLAFFIAFEPNNYFGLKASATSSQPVARVRAYQQEPGTNLILGDSRLAHFDMGLVDSLSGQSWQNLAFGGASLKETLDLADYLLDSGHDADTLLVEVSFYTLNAGYNTDRFATLEETLNNPLAYCFNLEYNVNALTVAMDTLRGTPDTIESGDWAAADYLADDGTVLPLHRKLYDYTATITPRCKSWALNDEQFNRLHTLARRCQSEGVRLIVVLPPMADNVRTEVCDVVRASPRPCRARCCRRWPPGLTNAALPCWITSGAAALLPTMTSSFLTDSIWMSDMDCRSGRRNCLGI